MPLATHAGSYVPEPAPAACRDQLGRPLRDLRLSVIDQCNFRCTYCMPKERFGRGYPFLSPAQRLSDTELLGIVRAFVGLGVEKVRLTGGEPLLRKGIESLVEGIASMRTLDGAQVEVAMTTNGSLLARKARALRDAGLGRVTVSLDSLDGVSVDGGRLHLCLFATSSVDLRPHLSAARPAEALAAAISQAWQARGDRYSELRAERLASGEQHPRQYPTVRMSLVGG
ncbi:MULTISPECIES: radical SAM protein [unclassified Cupriavidus]|uniref:radical SAM protein n=1 Tax=unclassified Cupriavidus TaxID=2640874 RepID=UPI00295F16C4|nr:radical SAM protein [Cupriavidus sp. TA19]